MGDLLLQLSGNGFSRGMLGMVGLPTPQELTRLEDADTSTPLDGLSIDVGGGLICPALKGWVEESGAIQATGSSTDSDQPAAVHALVFDASELDRIDSLRALHQFFHSRIRQVARCGRVVVIARSPLGTEDPEVHACFHALKGFTKSLAKELGRRGATANLISLSAGCQDSLKGPLLFFLSHRSSFVTGQILEIQRASDLYTPRERFLEGRTAVVTGAARGIGRATVHRLAQEGARVICLDLPDTEELLDSLAREVGGVPLPVDITADGVARQMVEVAGCPLDAVVHNAGITRDKTLARMPETYWSQALSVNLGAVHRISTDLLDSEGLSEDGRLVLISSVAGIAGNVGQTNYAASKAGVIGLTQALSRRVDRTRQAVNAIAPGFVETRLTAAIPFTIREGGRRLSNLGQGGQPQDIADAICFFSSAASAGLNGQTLRVCGGSYLGA
jgi:3-oxoacyl-[acyl-carrier protein] reductase